MIKYFKLILILGGLIFSGSLRSQNKQFVTTEKTVNAFTLTENGVNLPILADSADFKGVLRVVNDLRCDFKRVTGDEPALYNTLSKAGSRFIVIGTVGHSGMIDELIKTGKLDSSQICGKKEKFIVQTLSRPFAGVEEALVIAGSDKRGTIYGIYELSEQIGVSPWYYWADVPVKKSSDIYIDRGTFTDGEPAVQYRGIFINDEAPALTDWCFATFGGFNHMFYETVYELILRLKGNFLWPAMWGRSLFDDDALSAPLADEYGIIIGTSHHEPMGRAHVEWSRYGKGKWNYDTNPEVLRDFWRKGLVRAGSTECIMTVGMRGDGDEPMSEESNIQLLENIVSDQRAIISDVTGKDASKTPQMWALYKEVQDYYDKGMRVPDDITLLLCDDNWGNVRKLPLADAPKRSGGYGMYYHFDYVGDPRNYKWLNTNQIERTWEQMHLCKEYGVDKLWIVNVGDIKPMEYPISFFLDYAWNPSKWHPGNLQKHTEQWCTQQFGAKYAKEIAEMIAMYTKYNSRRKPELLSPETYSLVNYREAETVVEEYNDLMAKAEEIYEKLPSEYRDAYDQLVLFPIQACANLNEMYVTVGLNHLCASQGRNETNKLADKVSALYERDSLLTLRYHTKISGGKWNHMMSQTHIGYTYWQQPLVQVMPKVKRIDVTEKVDVRLALEGDTMICQNDGDELSLPEFDSFRHQSYFVELFNTGSKNFNFKIKTSDSWIVVSEKKGSDVFGKRILVSVNWEKVKNERNLGFLKVTNSDGKTYKVNVFAVKHVPVKVTRPAFAESNKHVSIEAVHYSKAVNTSDVFWRVIPNLGRTLSSVTTFPVITPFFADRNAVLEYDVYLCSTGKADLTLYLSPTLNFNENQGLRYSVSIDGGAEQIVNFNKNFTDTVWKGWVADNIILSKTSHIIDKPGFHTIRYKVLDSGVVLQKIVLDFGGVRKSYLGPPESKNLY